MVHVRAKRVRTLSGRGVSARHFLALDITGRQSVDISEIANALLMAVHECEATDTEPSRDPAVLLISAHLTLVTSADRVLHRMYARFVDTCQQEVENDLSSIPAPENQH